MASKYSVIVEASIKESSIQAQLNNISKNYVFNIKAKIDLSDIENQIRNVSTKLGELRMKAEQGVKTKSVKPMIDTTQDQKSLDALYAKIEQIKLATGASAIKFDIFTEVGEDGEKITKALLTYNDTLGNVKKETYQWATVTKQVGMEAQEVSEWLNTANKYTDDGTKKERQRQLELKKSADLVARMNQQADSAIAKTVGRNQRIPEVQEVIKAANALKLATAAGNTEEMARLNNELKNSVTRMGNLGKETLSVSNMLSTAIKKVAIWAVGTTAIYGTIRAIKQMIEVVKQLDTSLVELQKVSDLSGASLRAFTDEAFRMGEKVGKTGKEAIDATTEFVRAGYDVSEALKMGESALIMTNVAEGIDNATEATSALIAVLRGFNMEADQTQKIVDVINEVNLCLLVW